jgi:photosystem II stability/assembly factor-like uncharacterized protein
MNITPHRAAPLLLALPLLAVSLLAQADDRDHLRQNVLAQMTWRELGPVNFGGRIVDLAVHPQNSAVFWVAAASGGLWKTTNGGISFAPQFQDAYSISIGDIAVAESAPDTLYVGTGESNNQRSSYWGNGVYKSTDGGATFAHVGLDGTEHIGRIAVHPQSADIVFVAALGALYSSNEHRGLYRSKDGGSTWECVKHLGADVGFVDVAIDPRSPDVVYAASYERRRRAWDFREGGPGSRLWKSTDGGSTWVQLEGGLPQGDLGRIGLDLYRRDPRTLYATIENLNPRAAEATPAPPVGEQRPEEDRRREGAPAEILADPLAAAEWEQGEEEEAQDPVRARRRPIVGGEVWRSDDAGASWRKTNTTPVGGNPGYYYGQIRVDPNDSERVYVLSIPVYSSADGGATWTPRSGGGGGGGNRQERGSPDRGRAFHGNLHVDHHALWIDPADSRHCILGNDGGLGITWDRGATWDHVARLPIAQFYTVAVDSRRPYRVYGGLQDNGTWGFPVHAPTSAGLQPQDAYRIDGGDGFMVCCDPDDPDVVYSESQFGAITRQNLRTGERRGIRPKAETGSQPLRFNWMTPLLLSPHAPHTLYAGSQFVHRSRDRGNTWTTISGDLTTNDPEKKKGDVPHCTITMLAESPKKEGCLWAGTDDGRVWRSADGGQRWQNLDDRFPEHVRGLWVSRIEASPHAAATAFVSFTGYREDRREPLLFRTDDGGDTFRAIHNDLPQEPINVVRQHPANARLLLVGIEMGVYASIDDGAAWHPLGKGLPRVAVHDLCVHPREHHVLIGTHGRGIWALDGRGLPAIDAEALGRDLAVLPPSDGVLLRRAVSAGTQGARTWSVPSPFTTATFSWLLREDTDAKVQVEVVDAAGTVLFRHEADGTAGYHEVAWQAPRGPGAGGGGGGGRGGGARRQGGQRAGLFAVRIRLQDHSATLPFSVQDLRGPRDALGAVAAAGAADEDFGDDDAEADDGEDEEHEAPEEPAAPAIRDR